MAEFKLTLSRLEDDGQTSELNVYLEHETGTLPASKLRQAVGFMVRTGNEVNRRLLVPMLVEDIAPAPDEEV